MASRAEDLAFARYCAARDPEELAQVFDLTAGKVLLVAAHVTRDAAQADDLVQATFLAAIEASGRFEPGKPVLPWLLGILSKEARMARRRERLRAHAALPEAVLAGEPAPADVAGAAEEAAHVAAALDAVPEECRTVLTLRFVHGLRAVEIARALGRPAATVRSQVHRGLEQLRRHLPQSLGVPALAAWAEQEGGGLAAVRAAVLREAGLAAPTAAAAGALGIGGLLMAKKLVFAAAAVVVALLCATWFLRTDAAEGDVGPRLVDAPAASPAEPIANAPPASRQVAAEGRAAATSDATPAPANATSAPALARLTGRCVAAENGEPLAGCSLTLSGWQAVAEGTGDKRERWPAPAPVVTGADGRFELAFDPPTRGSISFVVETAGRVTRRTSWDRWPKGERYDVGDVHIERGVRVHGVVRNTKGEVVTAARVSAHVSDLPFGRDRGRGFSAQAETDARGLFDLGPVPLGTTQLRTAGHRLLRPTKLEVAAATSAAPIELVVAYHDPTKSITGVVVDQNDAPFLAASVSFSDGNEIREAAVRTDRDGRFELRCEADPDRVVTLDVSARDAKPSPSIPDVAWGIRDLRLVLERIRPATPIAFITSVEVQVVGPDGTTPVERFGVRCCCDPRACAMFREDLGRLREKGAHPGGRLLLTLDRKIRHVLFVEPEDQSLAAAGPLLFEVTDTAVPPVRVVLHRWGTMSVRVVDAAGAPVADTRVELLRPWGTEPVTAATAAIQLTDPFGVFQPHTFAVLLDAGTTDVHGMVRLRGPLGESGLVLRSPGPRNQPAFLTGVAVTPDNAPLELRVNRGASLTIQVVGHEALRRFDHRARARLSGPGAKTDGQGRDINLMRPCLLVRPASQPVVPIFVLPEWRRPIEDDGTVRCEAMPPGAHDAYLSLDLEPGFGRSWTSPPLERVLLADGESKSLQLDARPHAPGRIEGRLLLDGAVVAGTGCRLGRMHGPVATLELWAGPADDDGRFVLDLALPGTWQIALEQRDPTTGQINYLPLAGTFTVAPGETVRRDFAFVTPR